uniref:Uncharacterized protein n=1 Tax=Kalanchoe fedtschenkoi TaxID=63787 RepID=A0A7N0TFP0_KALFE
MDLEAAREHRGKLQVELDAISNGATTLSLVPRLVTMEVQRLDEDIARVSLRSSSDQMEGGWGVKVAVEGVLMMPKVSNEFGLNDQTSEEGFIEGLNAELEAVNNFHHPLPLTSQFIQRVVDRCEEQIAIRGRRLLLSQSLYRRRDPGEGSSSSAADAQQPAPMQHTRFWHENLQRSITDAINTAFQQNPRGATFDQVVDILRQNPSIQFDEEVRSIAYERFLGSRQSICGLQ